jgi:hypothetical protein
MDNQLLRQRLLDLQQDLEALRLKTEPALQADDDAHVALRRAEAKILEHEEMERDLRAQVVCACMFVLCMCHL